MIFVKLPPSLLHIVVPLDNWIYKALWVGYFCLVSLNKLQINWENVKRINWKTWKLATSDSSDIDSMRNDLSQCSATGNRHFIVNCDKRIIKMAWNKTCNKA